MNFKNHLYDVLKADARIWKEETKELNQTLLKDLIDKLDEKIVELLLNDKETKEKFFLKVNEAYILKSQDFKFFIDENKLDNSYTKYRNKIGLRAGSKLLAERDEVVLDWPFKDTILEGGMTKEDQKRNEIFFNEVLAQDEIDRLLDPKALANWKRYTRDGEEKVTELKRDEDGTIRENLIIKGNNLLALHSLKEQFTGKVKLIYIDPPYNRDSDTFYNDNFKRSSWLTFMRNRLLIANELLTEDGMIFIQIDEKQFGHLKVLADDIFNQFVTIITTKTRSDYGVAQEDFLYTVTEYILVYAKSKPINYEKYLTKKISEDSKFFSQYKQLLVNFGSEALFKKLETGKVGKVKIYQHDGYVIDSIPQKNRNIEYYSANLDLIMRTSNSQGGFLQKIYKEIPAKGLYSVEYIPTKGENQGKLFRYYIFDRGTILWAKNLFKSSEELERNVILTNLWDDISWLGIAKEGGVKLKNGKKPEALLKRIIETTTKEREIVLDYHLGSGTTCAVAQKMKRQFIGIEQLNYEENDSVARLKNVISGDTTGVSKALNWRGGSQFVYFELAKWNEEAKEKILKASSLEELEKLFDGLYERYFLNYNIKTKEFKEKTIKEEEFRNMSLDEQKKLFVEMLDMNQMYVNFSERNDSKYNLNSDDIQLSEEFYNSKK